MNKYEFFINELTDMVNDRADLELVAHYAWMSECAKFRDAVDYGYIIDKDSETYPVEIRMTINIDIDDFDISVATRAEEYSIEALHRKHRKSRRKAKVRRKNNDFVAGIGKGFKGYHHCAVRREYDIPMGKSNFSHKVDSYPFSY